MLRKTPICRSAAMIALGCNRPSPAWGVRGMSEMTSGSAPAQKAPSERAIPSAAVPNEKREHPRFKVEGATAVVGKSGLLGGLLGSKKHHVVNLSQGGAMVCISKRLPVGSKHDIRIEIPKYKEIIEAAGEI